MRIGGRGRGVTQRKIHVFTATLSDVLYKHATSITTVHPGTIHTTGNSFLAN